MFLRDTPMPYGGTAPGRCRQPIGRGRFPEGSSTRPRVACAVSSDVYSSGRVRLYVVRPRLR